MAEGSRSIVGAGAVGDICGVGHFLLCVAEGACRVARFDYGLGCIVFDTAGVGVAGSGAGTCFGYDAGICGDNTLS